MSDSEFKKITDYIVKKYAPRAYVTNNGKTIHDTILGNKLWIDYGPERENKLRDDWLISVWNNEHTFEFQFRIKYKDRRLY